MMKRVLLIAALVSLGTISLGAAGGTAGEAAGTPDAQGSRAAFTPPENAAPRSFASHAPDRHPIWDSHDVDRHRHEDGRGGPPMPFGFAPPDPLRLAGMLSAMETLIGVRSDQLDAWRAYTDAVQDFMTPPARPDIDDNDDDLPDGDASPAPTSHKPAAVLGQIEADRVIERAEKARKLEAAIATLSEKLTNVQLEKFADASRPPMPGPGHLPGPGPDFHPGPPDDGRH